MEEGGNWRDELKNTMFYRKVYAFLPVQCGEERVWLKNYYREYNHYNSDFASDQFGDGHTEFSRNVTEEEFVVLSLTNNVVVR